MWGHVCPRGLAAGRKPKILIIGHGRHGKDAAAAFFCRFGLVSVSSSEYAARLAVFPLVSDLWPNWRACWADRHAHRELWFHAIAAYNLRPGPSLVERALADVDIYVGMRNWAEFARARSLFDLIIWVDRAAVEALEPAASMELTAADADLVLDNNGALAALEAGVLALVSVGFSAKSE